MPHNRLTDIVNETGGDRLTQAFTNAYDYGFDPDKKGDKDRQTNFENYVHETVNIDTVSGSHGSPSHEEIDTGGENYSIANASLDGYGVEWRESGGSWSTDNVSVMWTNGGYSATISNLDEDTTYEFRAYLRYIYDEDTNYYYASIKSFTTNEKPNVDTRTADEVDTSSFRSGGENIVRSGDVTSYGVKYKKTYNDDWTKQEEGTSDPGSSFLTTISGLDDDTSYDYKAYITVEGIDYEGDVKSVTTDPSDYISVDPDQVTLTYDGDTADVTVEAGGWWTTEYDYGEIWGVEPDPWFELEPDASGSGTTSVTVKCIDDPGEEVWGKATLTQGSAQTVLDVHFSPW